MPILAFVRRRDIPTVPSQRDSDPKQILKLETFIQKVTSNAMVDFWETEEQLAQKVIIALVKTFNKTPRIGWIKSDKAASPQIAEEFVSLSRENRELKAKFESLNSLMNNRKPNFEVLIDGNDALVARMNSLPSSMFGYIAPIHRNKIPEHLIEFISDSQIEKFNNAIKQNAEVVSDYNTKFIANRRKLDLLSLEISIKNTGSVKATAVIIDLNFPEEILVCRTDDDFDNTNPTWPAILPKHPMVEADNAFERKRYVTVGYPKINTKIMHGIQPLNRESWVDVNAENNLLTLRVKDILHTRTFTFKNEIFFAPLKCGHFVISGSLICEELENPIEISFPVDIYNTED